jgi:hypothetical protein
MQMATSMTLASIDSRPSQSHASFPFPSAHCFACSVPTASLMSRPPALSTDLIRWSDTFTHRLHQLTIVDQRGFTHDLRDSLRMLLQHLVLVLLLLGRLYLLPLAYLFQKLSKHDNYCQPTESSLSARIRPANNAANTS